MELKEYYVSKNWMGSVDNYEDSQWILSGIPFDGTCSYRPGSRFAPSLIRLASYGIEEYSPVLKKTLCDDVKFFDAGEMDLPFGNTLKTLDLIYNCTKKILNDNKKVFSIGGEHLVSLPIIKAYQEIYKDLVVVHFDAHTDLRYNYLGEKLSHATVIRQVVKKIKPQNLIQIGIRSGEQYEFEYMINNGTLYSCENKLIEKIEKIKNAPVYITLDIDVLDSSVVPGTGTPEPGGYTYNELINKLKLFLGKNIVGMDLVELAPDYDKSGASTVIAAKIIREMLLMFG